MITFKEKGHESGLFYCAKTQQKTLVLYMVVQSEQKKKKTWQDITKQGTDSQYIDI